MTNSNSPAPAPGAAPRRKFLPELLLRFHRSSWGQFYNYHEYRLKRFVQRLAAQVRPESVLLDVGAGDCQYKRYFAGKCKYVSQDIGGKSAGYTYDQIDIRSEIYEIPMPDGSVDFILCTQVLEHLKYPVRALSEMSRLLKPGGHLYLTVPFCAEEHMLPYDYFRYTRYSLDFLMREQGLVPVEINPQGGRFIFLGKTLKDTIPLLTYRSGWQKILWLAQAPLIAPVMLALFFLDKIDKDKNLTQNYDVIARKP